MLLFLFFSIFADLFQFKHRSQKLLRAWTVQDTETHAIQWKLRLRPKAKSAARRWQGFTNSSTPNNTGLTEEENNQQDNNDDNRDRLNNTTVGASSTTYLSPNHPRLHQQASPQNSQEEQEQQEQGHQTSESASQSSSAQIIPPPRVADVYSALRNPTRITTDSTVLTTQPTVTTVATTTTVVTDMEGEGDLEAGPAPPRSKWEPWKELLMELYCCAYLFKQKKIWMIEISLRENLLDEYALPVPSPVYCDYRLPGYDDVMSGNLTPSTMVVQSATSTASTITVTRQGTIPTTRYLGSPPAYESDSENDSDDEDGQDDDEGIDSEAESVHLPTNAPVTRGSQSEMSSVASMSVAADSVHRPLEMTTIVIVPSIKDIRSGEDSSRDEGVEDRHEEVMRSMTSMTTLCASATTSRATLPMPLATVDSEDKEAGQSKERGD